MLISVKKRQIETYFIWDISMSGIFVNNKKFYLVKINSFSFDNDS